MSNWTSNTAPNYYTDISDKTNDERPFHPNDNGSLFQTDRGWEREIVYTDQHGRTRTKRYVEIADREAQTDATHIHVTDVRVQNATDYSTAVPTVNGGSLGDSFDLEITFNQAVAITSPGFIINVLDEDGSPAVNVPTYKSGNMTSQLTWTISTATLTGAVMVTTEVISGSGDLVAWDRISNTVHSSGLTIPATASANLAHYGAEITTITASGEHGIANTVIA